MIQNQNKEFKSFGEHVEPFLNLYENLKTILANENFNDNNNQNNSNNENSDNPDTQQQSLDSSTATMSIKNNNINKEQTPNKTKQKKVKKSINNKTDSNAGMRKVYSGQWNNDMKHVSQYV